MLALENSDTRRACTLIHALHDREITMLEFTDALRPVSSEALQVVSTFLRSSDDMDSESLARLRTIRSICRSLAAKTRCLS